MIASSQQKFQVGSLLVEPSGLGRRLVIIDIITIIENRNKAAGALQLPLGLGNDGIHRKTGIEIISRRALELREGKCRGIDIG